MICPSRSVICLRIDGLELSQIQVIEEIGSAPQSVEAPEAFPLLYIATEDTGAELVTFRSCQTGQWRIAARSI